MLAEKDLSAKIGHPLTSSDYLQASHILLILPPNAPTDKPEDIKKREDEKLAKITSIAADIASGKKTFERCSHDRRVDRARSWCKEPCRHPPVVSCRFWNVLTSDTASVAVAELLRRRDWPTHLLCRKMPKRPTESDDFLARLAERGLVGQPGQIWMPMFSIFAALHQL